jgi:hypothetical protein
MVGAAKLINCGISFWMPPMKWRMVSLILCA